MLNRTPKKLLNTKMSNPQETELLRERDRQASRAAEDKRLEEMRKRDEELKDRERHEKFERQRREEYAREQRRDNKCNIQ